MARDSNQPSRDLMVIPGGLLAVYSLLGMLYTSYLRGNANPCSEGAQVLIGGACYRIWLILLPFLLLGILLVILGIVLFRGRADRLRGLLYPGTGARFTLWLLGSLFVVPLLAVLGVAAVQDPGSPYVVSVSDVELTLRFLLAVWAAVAALMLAPYAGLYVRDAVARRRILERATENPLDEPEWQGLVPEEDRQEGWPERREALDGDGEAEAPPVWPRATAGGPRQEAPPEPAADGGGQDSPDPPGEDALTEEETEPASSASADPSEPDEGQEPPPWERPEGWDEEKPPWERDDDSAAEGAAPDEDGERAGWPGPEDDEDPGWPEDDDAPEWASAPAPEARCTAITQAGHQCKKPALPGSRRCGLHEAAA